MNPEYAVGGIGVTRKMPDPERLKLLLFQPMDLEDMRGIGPALADADCRYAHNGEMVLFPMEGSFHFYRENTAPGAAIAGYVNGSDQ